MLYAIIAILVVIADQWIKLYVSTQGNIPAEGIQLIPGFLNLRYVENTGGPFGFLSGQNAAMWFVIAAGVFLLLVIIALATKFISGPTARWSIVLVAAGGVSNAIDRLINIFSPVGDGHVVDMFQFDFAKWFPVFNLADIVITIFLVVFIFAILFGKSDSGDDTADEFSEDEEEEEPEEEEVRKPKRGRKSRKAAQDEDEDEEEELEEEKPAKPARSNRKARQARYDEEYEQYKADQRARQEAAAQPAVEAEPMQPKPAATVQDPAYNPADPFAEWERANAAQQPAASPTAFRPAATVVNTAPQSPRPAAPAPAPVQPKPVQRPAAKPVEAETSFDLDDILAEFK